LGTVFADGWVELPFMTRTLNENAGVLSEMEANSLMPAKTDTHSQTGVKSRLLMAVSCGLLIAGIVALGWFSFGLAARRIYQVDECSNVFIARLIATGHSWPGMDLFQVILSRLMFAGRSVDFYAYARELSLMVFWLNWILLALATGERILSRRWLVALAFVATLAPLWDFGFEVRHDNLLLAGILLMWGLVRFQPPRASAYFFVGACSVVLEFVAVKAVLYTLPISVAITAFPLPGARQPRLKLFAAWCVGAVVAFFAVRFALALAGVQLQPFGSGGPLRFWPFHSTFLRLLIQTPLLVAITVAALAAAAGTLIRERRAALNWDGIMPEAMLFAIALAALFVNPGPYPYNLLYVTPFAFLLAFRYGCMVWKQIPQRSSFALLLLCVAAFTHLVPFAAAARRHGSRPNDRQEQLMTLTEDLTDPQKDTYFDAIGMVPTRAICDSRSLFRGQSGPGPHIQDILAANPPSVIIPNYRTDGLPREYQDFMRERYVSVADDLLVLGNLLPTGGGTFRVYHAGRYRITSAAGSNVIGAYPEPKNFEEAIASQPKEPPIVGTIDGVPLNGRPVQLSMGTHRIECEAGQSAAVVWVGPHMDEIARMPGYNHHLLFDNWY
jgi:hypothetical protein